MTHRNIGIPPANNHQERGMVLITAMWISIALAAVVLVLCREMSVEMLASRQALSQAQAETAETGMEQFVLSQVEQEMTIPGYLDQTSWEARRVGESYCWVLGAPADDYALTFGVVDEASKLDINTMTYDMMLYLPGMTEDIAYSIRDWIDEDDTKSGLMGAESQDYLNAFGYQSKNRPLESLEELRLIYGLQGPDGDLILRGADANQDGLINDTEAANADPGLNFATSMRGIMPFITAYGVRATNPNQAAQIDAENAATDAGETYQALVDVNTLNNNTGRTALRTMLTTYLTSGNGNQIVQRSQQTSQQAYTSIWDWAVKVQLTSADMTEIYPYLACNPRAATNTGTGGGTTTAPAADAASLPTPPFGKLNLNTATKPAMLCLPGFTETEADAVIAYREQNYQTATQVDDISWIMDTIDPTILQQAGAYITGKSTVFSADIVTVSRDGRAFKRVKIVVDASSGTPAIIYRRDLSAAGFPLDPQIRESLRKGEEPQIMGNQGGGSRSSNNPLQFGIR